MQTYLLAGLFAVAAAVAPFTAQLASHTAYSAALRAEQAQLAGTRQVRATLTDVARRTVNANVVTPQVPVRAAWTSVTGVHRTGMVLAAPGTAAGTVLTVWTSDSGDLASPPLRPSQVTGQADLAAAGAITGIGLLYLCAAVIIRHVFHRRRMAAWAAAWVVTARTWNRQTW